MAAQIRRLPSRYSITMTIVLALVAMFAVRTSFSALAADGEGGVPADKAVAAGSKRIVVGPQGAATLLTATFKTSKPSDLLMQVALECSLFTKLLTNNTDSSATAGAKVRAWLEIDGDIVPIVSSSTPPQDGSTPPSGGETDKVTFCDREYSRTVTDAENPLDGVDSEEDYIRTKSSHAFNWVRLNAGSGVHTVALKADITTTTDGANATAEAEVGNRTLIIEPTKMANNADVSENGTSDSGNN